MQRHEYKAISTGVGAALRGVYDLALRHGGRAGRAQIVAALYRAGIVDPDVQDRIVARCVALAEKRGSTHPRALRTAADQVTLETLRELRAADSLTGDDRLEGEPDAETTAAARQVADATTFSDRIALGEQAVGTYFDPETGATREVRIG